MKNLSTILFVVIALFTSLNATAQNYTTIKAGIKATQPAAAANEDLLEPIGAFTFGLHYERGLNKRISILTGVDLSSRGFSYQENTVTEDFYFEHRVSYIDVPLAAKFQLGSDKFGLQLTAGGTFGYAIHAKSNLIHGMEVEGEMAEEKTSEKLSFEEEGYNRFNTALLLGAGIYGKIGRNQLFLDYTMEVGMNEWSVEETGSNFVGGEFSAGIRIPIGKKN